MDLDLLLFSRITFFSSTFNAYIFVLCLQCNIGGVILHICNSVGPWAVCTVWNSVCRLHHPAECDSVCRCGTDVFPAVWWRSSLVVALHLQCWVSAAFQQWAIRGYPIVCTKGRRLGRMGPQADKGVSVYPQHSIFSGVQKLAILCGRTMLICVTWHWLDTGISVSMVTVHCTIHSAVQHWQ